MGGDLSSIFRLYITKVHLTDLTVWCTVPWYTSMGYSRGCFVAERMGYVTTRIDAELKAELEKACEIEGRKLSTFCRLLLEYGWNSYLRAGSIAALVSREAMTIVEEDVKNGTRY
jgi:hypothetical protein